MPSDSHAPAPEWDLVVVGGGINGAGVARDASWRGLRVALVERADFASGASSKTSKLIHGGLRYLESGALGLVHEACRERRILLRCAPHVVRPLEFVFPVYRSGRIGPWRLRAGMWLYDILAAFRNVRRHRMLDLASAALDGLRRQGLRAAASYYDAAMDDARLVVLNLVDAHAAGARIHNYTRMTRFLHSGARVTGVEAVTPEGATRTFTARAVVVCTGAWTNDVLAALPDGPRPVAPTRGTHLVVPRFTDQAFTLTAGRDGRVFFVLPWLGHNLIGTTDVDVDRPDADEPSPEEIDYLLEEVQRFFPEVSLRRDDVIAAFAGLRPLQRGGGDATSRSREHAILEPLAGLFCVVGGKYTTFRAVAEELVDRVLRTLERPVRSSITAHRPLPGGDLPWSPEEHWTRGGAFLDHAAALAAAHGIPRETATALLERHGTRAEAILRLVAEQPDLRATPPGQPRYLMAEVVHAIRQEWTRTLEDWYLRRTRWGYQRGQGRAALEAVADSFARERGWDAARRAQAVEQLREHLERAAVSALPTSSRSS